MKNTFFIITVLFAATTHSALADTVKLRNGRVIHGKVIGEFPSTATVKITFTGGGSLTLDPRRILRVRRDSRCDFRISPVKPESARAREDEKDSAKKPGAIEKPEEKKTPGKKEKDPDSAEAEPVEPELDARIRGYVNELSRQRSQNRVRAEAALKRLGPVTLPYLEKVARHPFALTRRAVIRIVAETGGGSELLRAALKDEDPWVKKLAADALKR